MPTEDWSFDLLFNNHSYSGRNILNPPKYIQPTLQDARAFSTSIKQRMTSPEKSFNPSCITLLSKHIAKNLPVVPLPGSVDSILYNLDAISCSSSFKCRINTVKWESRLVFFPPCMSACNHYWIISHLLSCITSAFALSTFAFVSAASPLSEPASRLILEAFSHSRVVKSLPWYAHFVLC